MARALLDATLCDMNEWCVSCRQGSAAAFAALAHNPSLIEPMRAAYGDLHRRVAQDGLPEGVGDAVVAAIDGLWLYWVLGLVPVDQKMIVRVRKALLHFLSLSQADAKRPVAKRVSNPSRKTPAPRRAAPRRK